MHGLSPVPHILSPFSKFFVSLQRDLNLGGILGKEVKKAPVASMPKKPSGQLRLYAIGVGLVGFLLYINTVKNGYALDDFNAIPKNTFVMEGIPGIPKLMTIDFWYFENLNLGYYRPLSLITFAIEHSFFGEDPSINHFDNALLYGLSGFVLCLFLIQLFPSRNPAFAFLISLVFMAHPIHTEVVANIKSRDEILSFLNTFLTLFFAFRYGKSKMTKDLVWSILFFYLALLSKETAVVGLALIPLFLFYSGLNIPSVIKRSWPYACVALLFFMQKRYFLGGSVAHIPNDIINYPYVGQGVKMPSVFHIFWICLQKLVYPLPLSYDYSYNQVPASHWTDIGALLGIVSFLALAGVALRGFLKRTEWSLGLSILFITIAPSLGFVFLRGGILAERFLYAPCLGFALILAYALTLISKQKKDRALKLMDWVKTNTIAVVTIFVLCSFYGFATVQRNHAWKDNITLFGTDVNHSTNSAQVHRHYGTALIEAAAAEKDTAMKRGFFTNGVSELNKAIDIDTMFGEAYCEIGYAYQGVYLNVDSAIKYFKRAIETAPALVTSYNNLGVLYQNTGHLKLASYYYNKALEVNPHYPDAIQHAADLKKTTGLDVHEMPDDPGIHNVQVIKTIKSDVIAKSPKDVEFNNYFNEGASFVSKQDYESAIGYLEKAEAIKPEHEQAMLELANCYGLTKRYPQAIRTFKKILRYYPGDKAVMGNLAVTYQASGQMAKADSVRAVENQTK